jgi:dUTP pyrophosphatase
MPVKSSSTSSTSSTEGSTAQLSEGLARSLTGLSVENCTQTSAGAEREEREDEETLATMQSKNDSIVAIARALAPLECGPGLVIFVKTSDPYLRRMYSQLSQAHAGDSGVDLYCPEDVVIRCGETKRIDLGIACEMRFNGAPQSFYIHPRSSLSKTPLMLANCAGVIDAGYRGNLMSALKYVPTSLDLLNIVPFLTPISPGRAETIRATSEIYLSSYKIEKGQRLVQICGPNLMPIRVAMCDALTTTTRGDKGFGSTGK